MNTTKRNPKTDPRAGDLLWRPLANGGWQCIQVRAVTRAFVRYGCGDAPDAAEAVCLPHWQWQTKDWRLEYPSARRRESAWTNYWPRPREPVSSNPYRSWSTQPYDDRR